MEIAESVNFSLNIIISGFAGYQIADTWIVGSLFKHPRKWLEKRKEQSKLAELLTCPFCLSHWTVFLCLMVMLMTGWGSIARIPIYWLAAVRVATMVQREEEIELNQEADVEGITIVDD